MIIKMDKSMDKSMDKGMGLHRDKFHVNMIEQNSWVIEMNFT